MKRALALILSLTLITPIVAMTDQEPVCVKAYREANADFFSTTSNLQNMETTSAVAKYSGIPGGLACAVMARRSIWGILACTTLGIGVTGAGHVGENMSAAAIERERGIHQMEDTFLIYQIYYAHVTEAVETSVDVGILLNGLSTPGISKEVAAAEVARLVESGELCNDSDKPAVGYWDMLDLLKANLTNVGSH